MYMYMYIQSVGIVLEYHIVPSKLDSLVSRLDVTGCTTTMYMYMKSTKVKTLGTYWSNLRTHCTVS